MRKIVKPHEVDSFGNKHKDFQLLTKKAITPSQEEINQNPRSRSSLLRVLKNFK